MKHPHDKQLSAEALAMYKEHILDHARHPRNFGIAKHIRYRGDDMNALCGDDGTLGFDFGEDGRVNEVGFEGKGCAVSQASLSLLTEYIKGKTREEMERVSEDDIFALLKVPITYTRIQCALLSWRALKKALKNRV